MKNRVKSVYIGTLLLIGVVVFLLGLGCGSSEPSPTRVPQPTAAPVPQASAVPAATPTPVRATPIVVPQPKAGPNYGGTLRYTWWGLGSIKSLDPHYSFSYSEYMVNYAMYNNLVEITAPDGVIGPDLAQSWDFSQDGKTVTFNLVRNAKYHDGTDFDAESAKKNLSRVMDKEVGASQAAKLEPIERIEVVDKYTLKLHLKRPWRPLLAALAERPGWMPSPSAVQKFNSYDEIMGDFGRNPVGSGPFKFREWIVGERITVDRFDQYFEEGLPYLDSIKYVAFNEGSVGVAMLRTGEVDMLDMFLQSSFLPLIRRNPDLKLIGGQSGRTGVIQFTVDEEPFDNKSLRQAVAYGLNRQAYIDAVYAGEGVPAYQWEGTGWAYNPNLKLFAYDAQKAKEKLVEAGYPNGVTLRYTCGSTTQNRAKCETIQALLSEVGINLEIDIVLSSEFYSKLYAKRDHGMYMLDTAWFPRGDPHGRFQILLHSDGFQTRTAHYKNPEVDRLMDEAGPIYDPSKAQSLYWKIQEIAAQDAVYAYLVHENVWMGATQKVRGFDWAPDTVARIRDVWLAK